MTNNYEVVETRGCRDLFAAEVLTDNEDGITFGTPFRIAGLANVSCSTETSKEEKFYDNKSALITNGGGNSDTITLEVSALSLDVLAKITGQGYDSERGIFIGKTPDIKYFALLYVTSDTSNHEHYVIRYKGQFNIPETSHRTRDNGTESAGMSLTFTAISPTYTWTTGEQRYNEIDASLDKIDLTNFFSEVLTPETYQYKMCLNVKATPPSGPLASGRTVYLETLTAGATIYYTDDGTTPDETKTEYEDGIILTESKTIKAIAIKSGLRNSDVTTFEYTID